ncbi:macrolide ABC transporter ATP-binding protein [Methanococcoides methylutens]|uniref:Macrolide ABC transporter ATP-binding protein n=1 Tax=Methanococcoides methylutens TaxID=2226 RepID=A0A099SZE7_METMT|nr:ABC transporter ATP-binding protein [Methanococcoides methylutens]KGK98262.1 macrolide ABC transporter ATP-binding protein [Methanococcoides methylutens]
MSDGSIQVKGLKKSYRIGSSDVEVLHNIDMEIKSGEFVSVMGQSGSGKTTLMNLIGMLDRPTGGSILIDGVDVTGKSQKELVDHRRKTVGFVFQQFHLIQSLTAYENVALPLVFAGEKEQSRIKEALERVNLSHRHDHKPSELSGGEQQRVAIARALVMGPKILLADEPTGALDKETGEMIISLLRSLRSEMTVVMITHNHDLAAMSGRIINLQDGKIKE